MLLSMHREKGYYCSSLEKGMRKFVIALVVTLAVFTFIRDFPSSQTSNRPMQAEVGTALRP